MPTTYCKPRHLALGALLLVAACGGREGAPSAPTADVGAPGGIDGEAVVAHWTGGEVTQKQLESVLADELRQMDVQYRVERYERLHDALDGLVEDQILDAEVLRRGLTSRQALLQAVVDARLGEPDERELKQEYERFLEQVPDADFEGSRPFLRKQILNARRQALQAEFVRDLKEQAGLTVVLPFPEIPRVEVPIDAHDPVLGLADAPLTIVQFGGYQCYYCRRVNKIIEQLITRYDGRVRLVYKDFPLAGHARARAAAIAAHCAGAQGKYWPMAEILLENQGRLEDEHLASYARTLGLNATTWGRCMQSPEWGRSIDEDVHLGRELGVSSTPTFFFNGLMVTGAHPYDRFAALVDQELARLETQ